jgi:hypothetical protein
MVTAVGMVFERHGRFPMLTGTTPRPPRYRPPTAGGNPSNTVAGDTCTPILNSQSPVPNPELWSTSWGNARTAVERQNPRGLVHDNSLYCLWRDVCLIC